LGRGGLRARKREGDGATPIGVFSVRGVLYRPDCARRPRTGLPVARLRGGLGWCDAPEDRNYNRPVVLPYPARTERLWRADRVYDLIAVLGYNDRPRVKGRGSAIFLHLAQSGHPPTAGCIALDRTPLLRLLRTLVRGAKLSIGVGQQKS